MHPTCNYYASGTCGKGDGPEHCTDEPCPFFSDSLLKANQSAAKCEACDPEVGGWIHSNPAVDVSNQKLDHKPEGLDFNSGYCPPLPEPESLSFVKRQSAYDIQIGGSHYKEYAIQPIEFFMANQVPYDAAAVIKYVMRHKDKNGREDLEKAKHLIDLMLEHYYGPSR